MRPRRRPPYTFSNLEDRLLFVAEHLRTGKPLGPSPEQEGFASIARHLFASNNFLGTINYIGPDYQIRYTYESSRHRRLAGNVNHMTTSRKVALLNRELAFHTVATPELAGRAALFWKVLGGGSVGLLVVLLGGLVVLQIRWARQHEAVLKRLRKSEKWHRLLFETSRDALMTLDPSTWKFTSANSAFAQMFGAEDEDHFISVGPVETSPERQPDGTPTREKLKETIETVMQEGSCFFEWSHYRFNGEEFPATVLLTRVDLGDSTILQATVRDITERKRAEESLLRSEDYYRTIFETSGTAMFIIEVDTIISQANSYFEELSGYSRQEVEGQKSWTEFIHPDDVLWMKENHYLRRQNPEAAQRRYEFRFITRRGEMRHLLLAADLIPGTNRSLASCIDITQQKNSEEELRVSEQRFKSIFDEGPFGMALVKPDSSFIAVNKVLCDLLGYTEQELVGQHIADITFEADKEKSSYFSRQLFAGSTPVVRFKKRYVRKNGEILWVNITLSAIHDKEGNIPYGQIIIESLTESRKAAEQIHLMAYYDSLTGMANLTFHKKIIKETIAHAGRYNKTAAIIYIGLDRFRRINDTLGYSLGDLLLKAVADRLSSFLRKSGFLAGSVEGETENVISRPGGDEFIVLAHDLNQARDAARLTSQLLGEISAPYNLDGREVFITASMGIALYPDDGTDVDELLLNAEKAMRHTKSKGINSYSFYSESMHSAVLEFLTLENDLHRALERKELVLYYQPTVDAASRRITGMEALESSRKGLDSTMHFIPIAETSGLICPSGSLSYTACAGKSKPGRRLATSGSKLP